MYLTVMWYLQTGQVIEKVRNIPKNMLWPYKIKKRNNGVKVKKIVSHPSIFHILSIIYKHKSFKQINKSNNNNRRRGWVQQKSIYIKKDF